MFLQINKTMKRPSHYTPESIHHESYTGNGYRDSLHRFTDLVLEYLLPGNNPDQRSYTEDARAESFSSIEQDYINKRRKKPST